MSAPTPLRPGLADSASIEVTDEMVPGHVTAPVISTPSLVSAIERTCRRTVLRHLPAGHDTVGTHVCVSHEGVATVGQSIEVRCRLVEVDGRHLTFEVEVDGPAGPVSRGTHRRAVVNPARFAGPRSAGS